ncbi:enoyl-CoA hydratase/isomerase family protein [Microscilla marina]|uniref:Putative enoyl-CoA hydratase n=1 Tax=Microscilla marina ATCC 23134 TaxID=313606 RepID=A1ZQ02_MICM2|nr:enoyl-CoA hydratase/isomerase family protein [Microscilla marina]EAY27411.1 putative enoyl-CoA hydratase [Microscilla marina ATCC 23134]
METLQTTLKNGYAIVTLDRGRANAMNAQMVTELRQIIKEYSEDTKVGGVILNGKENFFSAGLDVIELYNYDSEEIKAFWESFFGMIYEMAAFRKPLVAAITGHSPAGGCVLAVCCDYRVMAEGKYQIGLNEVPVGILINESISSLYAMWLGERRAYQFLMEGKLLNVQEAAEYGLVDEVVAPEKVLETAEAKMQQYLQFGKDVWQTSKLLLRYEVLDRIKRQEEAKLEATLNQWWNPATRQVLEQMIARLTKK